MKRVVVLAFLAFTFAALGQLTTADLVGTITDTTGAVAPNASVALVNLGTNDLPVEAGDRARADVHLQLGSEFTVVEVTASTPLLQADRATVSSTVTAKARQRAQPR